MTEVIFLLFRRMRAPLVVLILAYAIATIGLVLMPGRTPGGEPWHMSLFHAFYVVSYTGPTIGFGEIPYEFTAAQRLWTLFAIYTTVFAWLYAIGTLLAILQDPAFRRVVSVSNFRRSVRRLGRPFYIVCGFGENGALLVQALTEEGIQTVVVDSDQDRIDALKVDPLAADVPGLCADASDPEVLTTAGLKRPDCAGVIAVSRTEETTLSIAVASRLLAPEVPVICRARYRDTEANLASFGTKHIINPFDTFAERFALALRSPSMYLAYAWLTGIEHQPVARPVVPPGGSWILCGYGRFGKALRERLSREGLSTIVIEADPAGTGAPLGTVVGRGTEAHTLEEAGIGDADGIIAGTDSDPNNLSIILTAKALQPGLFTVARQVRGHNQPIFEAADIDLILDAGTIFTREVLGLITTPLLHDFLRRIRDQDEDWANVLISRISAVTTEALPETWDIEVTAEDSPALLNALARGQEVRLRHLLTDPRQREAWLPALPLLLKRGEEVRLLPEINQPLHQGDRLLFCGSNGSPRLMGWTTVDGHLFAYVATGEVRPAGLVWDWLARRGNGAKETGPHP